MAPSNLLCRRRSSASSSAALHVSRPFEFFMQYTKQHSINAKTEIHLNSPSLGLDDIMARIK